MPNNPKSSFLAGIFFAVTSMAICQDQQLADSLITLFNSGTYQQSKLELLSSIAENELNPDAKLEYSALLINEALSDSVHSFLISGYLQKGNAFKLKGNTAQALDAYLTSINYATQIDDKIGIGKLAIAIADTYSTIGNSGNAMRYYGQAIEMLRKNKDSIGLATALLNTGDEYFNTEKFDSALVYFEESGQLFEQVNFPTGTAYNLGNTGMVYAEQGKDVLAEEHINQAIAILEELEDYYAISVYLTYMADIYSDRLDFNKAQSYLDRSLQLAEKQGLKDQISAANLKLSELHEVLGDYEESHKYYKKHITYRDSVKNLEAIQQMADLRTNFEVSQKQVEVDLLNQQKRTQQIILGFIGLLLLASGAFYWRISKEKKRSEKLLLNILPADTAKELKQKGRVTARKFDAVTVLFTDFKGFTGYAESLSPEELVESVDYYFSRFDKVMEKHGLEKIKTIGDAYMCAGGLHFHKGDHALEMTRAAFEITGIMKEVKEHKKNGIVPFDIRIGINTGPVVAGVVGTKKFAYDIWGDAVNVASRMESNSLPGKINISENTYQHIKDYYNCEYRGELDVKNRGTMKMYFVNEIRDK